MSLYGPMMSLIAQARGTPGSSNTHDDRPLEMNRYMGGHRRYNHPFVNGYWYLLIEPPQFLFDQGSAATTQAQNSAGNRPDEGADITEGTEGIITQSAFETSRWLHSTAEGFTPPTRTLTKVDVPGMGGMGSSFVAGQQLTRTFSATFREYQDTPIFNAINRWTSVIDHHYGVSPMNGNEYLPANYKGAAYVFLCKPTLSNGISSTVDSISVDQFYFFEGVFPESSPYDGFNSDINTNDVVQLNITFSFDGWPYGREHEGHFKKGIELISTIYNYNMDGNFDGHVKMTAETLNAPTKVVSNIY